jgi:hypothetical protein
MMSINDQLLSEESAPRADESKSSLEVPPANGDSMTDKNITDKILENASSLKPVQVMESEAKPAPDHQIPEKGSGANSEKPERVNGKLTLTWVSDQDNERSSITHELSIDASKVKNDPNGENKIIWLTGSNHLTVNLKSGFRKIVENVDHHDKLASMSPLEKSFAMMVYDHPDWTIHQIADKMGLDFTAFKKMVVKLRGKFKARTLCSLGFTLLTDQLQWPTKRTPLLKNHDYHIASALATGQTFKALAKNLSVRVKNLVKSSTKYKRRIQENDLATTRINDLMFLHFAMGQVGCLKSRQTVLSQFGAP